MSQRRMTRKLKISGASTRRSSIPSARPPPTLGSRLFTQVSKALLAEREERGRPRPRPDKAHLLTYEQLEAIRMLTNTAMDQDSPLACLLVGQPPSAAP